MEWKADPATGRKKDPKVRSVDPVLLMLAERAEHAFGPDIIVDMAVDLNLSHSDMPTRDVLGLMANRFFHDYLMPTIHDRRHGSRVASTFAGLPKLSDESYVDYFLLFTTKFDSERSTDPTLYRATRDIQGILVGYQTGQAVQVCEGIVTFFNEMNDPLGMETYTRSLARQVKAYRENVGKKNG